MNDKSILNPKFKYVSSSKTDIKKTFKRIREEQAKNQQNTDATKIQYIDKKRNQVK